MTAVGVAGQRGPRMWRAAGMAATFARAGGTLTRIQQQTPDDIDLMLLRAAINILRPALRLLSMLARAKDLPDWDYASPAGEHLWLIIDYFVEQAGDHQRALPQLGQLTNDLISITKGRRLDRSLLIQHRNTVRALADLALSVA